MEYATKSQLLRSALRLSSFIKPYAHFYPRLEAARAELNIAAIPKQEQSNIMDRYYEMESTLDAARVKYVPEHIRELEQT